MEKDVKPHTHSKYAAKILTKLTIGKLNKQKVEKTVKRTSLNDHLLSQSLDVDQTGKFLFKNSAIFLL